MAHALEKTSFLYGANGDFIADLYEKYTQDPTSIDDEWQSFFQELGDDALDSAHDWKGPSWTPTHQFDFVKDDTEESKPELKLVKSEGGVSADTVASIRALMLIRAYRVRGHLEADLDPLKLKNKEPHPELDPTTYGFTEDDWDKPIFINNVLGLKTATLREIYNILRQTYCSTIGVEFMHIQDPEQKQWIQSRIEGRQAEFAVSADQRRETLKQLVEAISFEKFLHTKFKGAKRFGLDGGESTLAALEFILSKSAALGVEETVIGMAHRGRLNILANTLKKPIKAIFAEFKGDLEQVGNIIGSGDVKYHLGASADRTFGDKKMHLSLTPNPSHLEAVDPVVVGRVRAKQSLINDTNRSKVMGILMHGDAAFCGQGLVPEVLDLSGLNGYRTGGTIHLIINNQIGFTTNPTSSRSSPYSSDIAKGIQAPILHVNGDDPDAVVYVSQLAAEFRQTFKQNIVMDLFCYRRHGHNEMDEPSFTQPRMYEKIKNHPDVSDIYRKTLEECGAITAADADKIVAEKEAYLKTSFENSVSYKVKEADWLEGDWASIKPVSSSTPITGCAMELLQEVGATISATSDKHTLNSKILRLLKNRREMVDSGSNFDWATAEAMAFGTLLCDGFPVRLSGQDCSRGTFSQRHANLIDQETEEIYCPLNLIRSDQKRFEVVNSPLSEAGVLGFEYGHSLSDPNTLVLWEAQFGDFANGAQVIIDQFIAAAEAKWHRKSGLVMLLPHGYEGQGPEHSSARLERFLQLCAEGNLRVANCTTPANYFHILRRQVIDSDRKPLILMTPKSLLRHKLVVSSLKDMGPKTSFTPVIDEHHTSVKKDKTKRIVLCSGKVYYDLLQQRDDQEKYDVAIVRLEQMYPFPEKELSAVLKQYKNADLIWCQEEPENTGAWHFLDRRLEKVLKNLKRTSDRPQYVGRPPAASPATGLAKRHEIEQKKLVSEALETK